MAIKIEKKITGYNVVKPEDKAAPAAASASAQVVAKPAEPKQAEVIQMHLGAQLM